ncbi:multidrug MFS transporter, partial [Corynebacterium diphtheriae bv. gravis]
KTYLGFSTAAFQSGLLVGALTSGAISTYIGWRVMFLVPLILIVAVPFILKTVPEEEASSSHLDVVGLFLIAIFATSVIQYMQAFKLFWLAFMLVSIVIFVWYVRNAKNPVVNPEFFKNGRYVWAILLVLIVYSTQLGYIVLLPFAAKEFHGLDQAQASYLMIPGYICAVLIGIFSGKIGKLMTSRRTIFTALGMIIVALVVGALAIQVHVAVAIASIILFASGFALLYAPLVNTALANILPEKSGVAIGFYNLTINIGVPLGIAYTFKLMNLSIGTNAVIWILAAIAVVGAVMYFIADRALFSREKAAGIDSVANH